MNIRILFLFIIFILPIEAKAFVITDGTCKDRWIYSANIDNTTSQIYFWKTYLVDGHIARRSEFTYGVSFGNKLDCVRERNRKQNWDVQLIAARYANDPNARFVNFSHIEDEEFCKARPELLIEYCEPGRQDNPSNNSTIASIDRNISDIDNLKKLKSLLNDGIISQEDYDNRKIELLSRQDDSGNYSNISNIDSDLSVKEKLRELKSMLAEGLISQDQYDIKSTKILEEF